MHEHSSFSRELEPRAQPASLLCRLLSCLGGGGAVEYLIIVGACSLAGLIGFKQFGGALRTDLDAEAQHILGKGTPRAALPNLTKPPRLKPILDGFVPPTGFFPACGVNGCTTCPRARETEAVGSISLALTSRGAPATTTGGGADPRASGCSPTAGTSDELPPDEIICPPGYSRGFRGSPPQRVCIANCGALGTYRELGGDSFFFQVDDDGAKTRIPSDGSYPVGVPRDSNDKPYDRDHIPAKETLWLRAERFIDSAIATTWKENGICPNADQACIQREAKGNVNQGPRFTGMCTKSNLRGVMAYLYREVCLDGPVMVLPRSVHGSGRTYSRSLPGDVEDIPRAVERDLQQYYELINNQAGKSVDTSNCDPQDIRDAIEQYRRRDKNYYDELIRSAIERVLTERSDDFVQAIRDACAQCGG